MRQKIKKKMNLLPLALCAAAAIGGAWLGIVRFALSRLDAKADAPSRVDVEIRQTHAVPASAPLAFAAEGDVVKAAEEAPKPMLRHEAQVRPQPQPQSKPKPVTAEKAKRPAQPPAAKPAKAEPDLSAYRVNAIRSDGESLMPKDTSLSVKDLNQSQRDARKEKSTFDGGKGLLGDIYRGTKKFVDKVDETTLNASRKALGGVAEPNKATLRPSGSGVKLHLEIPPETVRIGR